MVQLKNRLRIAKNLTTVSVHGTGAAGTVTGANPYAQVAGCTITVSGLKSIEVVDDVSMFAAGYIVIPTAVAASVVTFHVYNPTAITTAANIVAAVTDHPVHAHDLLIKNNAGAADVIAAGAAAFESVGVTVTVAGAAAGGGVRNNAAAQAHVASKDIAGAVGTEVINGTNLNAVVFYATAVGY